MVIVLAPFCAVVVWYLGDRAEIIRGLEQSDARLQAQIERLIDHINKTRDDAYAKRESDREAALVRVGDLEIRAEVAKEKIIETIESLKQALRDLDNIRVRVGIIENTLSLRIFQRPPTPGDAVYNNCIMGPDGQILLVNNED